MKNDSRGDFPHAVENGKNSTIFALDFSLKTSIERTFSESQKGQKVTSETQPVNDFEKLGVFYLGKPFDLESEKEEPGYVLYESKHLTTHAVVVGMTGSGKTGLCIDLIEEAAIDNIPVLAIDPKGDISNLLLAFENLSPSEFQPWVSAEEGSLNGQSVDEFAAAQAKLWRDGIGSYGQDINRIKRLKESADFSIYTPFSSAGIQLSVLKSFACPPAEVLEDGESLRERVNVSTQSLLNLAGVTSDPLRGRESIYLGSIIQNAWQNGKDLSLIDLVRLIQTPPFAQVGALDLESFFPKKERFELAMAINNLIAAPGFETWMQGESLDIGKLLYTDSGKPRVSIMSIAHLEDNERMFFVALLLNQVISWMRGQTGTSSLRAILYMDEIFGYFPPVANPPSKQPLLTLLKQARAYGLGVVLATQNPVDLDYKGLANCGTWFVGRLQTERDKMRLLDGLEGVASEKGSSFDRQELDKMMASLKKRTFLLHNTQGEGLSAFKTRFSLSYLRGPLSRNQIKTLMDAKKKAVAEKSATALAPSASSAATPAPATTANASSAQITSAPSSTNASPAPAATSPESSASGSATTAKSAKPSTGVSTSAPILPPDVPQYVLPIKGAVGANNNVIYAPCILAVSQVRFLDTKSKLDHSVARTWVLPVREDPIFVMMDDGTEEKVKVTDLESTPVAQAEFIRPPEWVFQAKQYKVWTKKFQDWLVLKEKHYLLSSPAFKLSSHKGESEKDFRIRVRETAREQRDAAVAKLKAKYQEKLSTLESKIRLAEQAVEREQEQVKAQDMQTAISVGATVLGAFLGRRRVSSSTLGRATTAARAANRSASTRADVERANENLEALNQKMEDIEQQFQSEVSAIQVELDKAAESVEVVNIAAKKTNVSVDVFSFAWAPYQVSNGKYVPLWRQ